MQNILKLWVFFFVTLQKYIVVLCAICEYIHNKSIHKKVGYYTYHLFIAFSCRLLEIKNVKEA